MSHLGKADWSDPERVKSMVQSYHERYDADFWSALEGLVDKSKRDVIADFGCGPGLLLVDLVKRYSAHTAHALDESEEMLRYAETFLAEANLNSIFTHAINFDSAEIPLAHDSVSLGFSGFMLHEVASPTNLIESIYSIIELGGVYVVYDFVSGNKDAFVEAMVARGMSATKAEARYPHMCKHSVEDIEHLLQTAGFTGVESVKLNEMRAVVAGIK
ncbi:MAG: class I SAM-dependent methyltransferase [Candidatus Thorarchaeota archaeon]|nr:MAG: hypothetical protein DRP09_09675 [Candidatus Thorarchaeota archaeon]RLI58334.1 MAG: hypothetical protein DRO87_05980 [Candidatus Thorarchaeota archaeon]